MQQGKVYRNGNFIGLVSKTDGLYKFEYDVLYLNSDDAMPISVNLPLTSQPFESDVLFSFFANMLAEGNVKEIQCRDLRIDEEDHFTRLLKTTADNTIGSITIKQVKEPNEDKKRIISNATGSKSQALGHGLGELLKEIEEAYANKNETPSKGEE